MTGELLRSSQCYESGVLTNLWLRDCDLSGADLSRQVLVGSSFSDCNFTNASLKDAVISNASFTDGCTGLTASQLRSTWNYTNDRMDTVHLPRLLEAQLGSTQ